MKQGLPGKFRFQMGVIVGAWAMLAPASIPGWIVGALMGLCGFLVADGVWAALESGRPR